MEKQDSWLWRNPEEIVYGKYVLISKIGKKLIILVLPGKQLDSLVYIPLKPLTIYGGLQGSKSSS